MEHFISIFPRINFEDHSNDIIEQMEKVAIKIQILMLFCFSDLRLVSYNLTVRVLAKKVRIKVKQENTKTNCVLGCPPKILKFY